MRFGPTSLRLTSVLAKGLRRPKLRDDLKISEQVIAGESSCVIKIVETDAYARYGAFEYEILSLCDGARTAADITAAMNERHPDRPLSEPEVTEFLDGMDPNMWERSLGERNLAILEKIRDERKKKVDRASILYIYFSAWDPDKVLERLHPYLSWIYTRQFSYFALFLFALTAAIVIGDYNRIRDDTAEFYSFANKTAYDLWIFWWILFVISGIHEFGHGLTCKHFGGEVHQMGFMLMYFTPSFYTDCTDMYMFDKTQKRLWTIFAGIWIELVACAVATFVWFLSPPGSFIGDLGYKTLLLTGVSGVIINLNPLMKLDGYFALCQYLEIDNLRDDSFAYLKAWLRRYVLRQEVDLPPASQRKRRIFLIFGLSASAYSVMLVTLVTMFAKNVFTSKFGNWGYLFTAGLIYLILRKQLKQSLPAARAALRETKEKFMAWRMTRLQQGVAGAILLFVLIPTAGTVTTEFVLEPGARAEVRATTPGWVSEVRVREGDTVAAGSVLALLRNPDVETRTEMVARELKLAERASLAARAGGDLGALKKHSQDRERLLVERTEAEARRAALTLRAPFAGVVTTSQVELRVGDYLGEGDEFAVLADRRTMRARVLVHDWELEEVLLKTQEDDGAAVKLKLRAHSFRTFSGRVQQVMPAAAADRPVAEPHKVERKGQELTNYFAVMMEFPNPEGLLQEGMTGQAKIYGRRRPLVWRVARSGWRWFRSQVW